jgi:Tfp pilus assembly protein PilF
MLVILAGCASTGSPSSMLADHTQRDPAAASRLALQAAGILDSDPEGAERLLREALRLDCFNGVAHHNLGVIQLLRGDLFEAANEFESARRLMPGHPDPRCNLALVYEKAGRLDEAMAAFDEALQVQPGHLASVQGLVSLQLRTGKTDERTMAMLDEVALRGEPPTWREWAMRQRLMMSGSAEIAP